MDYVLRQVFAFGATVALGGIVVGFALVNTSGPGSGYSGSPGDGNSCLQCHGGTDLGSGPITISVGAGASTYSEGEIFAVTVTNSRNVNNKWGFQITAEDGSNNKQGTFTSTTAFTQPGSGNYQEHNSSGSLNNSWSFTWQAPSNVGGVGPITLYVASISSNDQGGNNGDEMYTASTTLTYASLPVELVSFDIIVDASKALLNWRTESEQNNLGFDVQHATGAQWFETIAFVEGSGTSSEPRDYIYTVDNLLPGKHRFRLRQVDFDGTATMSEQIEISVEIPDRFELSSAYPNPFNPSTTFRLAVDRSQNVVIKAADPLGRTVAEIYNGWVTENEPIEVRFDASGLPTGLYVVRAFGENFSASRAVMLVR